MPLGGSNDAPDDADDADDTKVADPTSPEAIKHLKEASERIDYSMDEIADQQANIKAVLARCKSSGLNAATVRKAVMLRRKRNADPAKYDEEVELLDLYLGAIT